MYDDLGALIAGEERDVKRAVFAVGRVLVEDGVHLSMAHIQVFGQQGVLRGLAPGQTVVRAAVRHAVVPNACKDIER